MTSQRSEKFDMSALHKIAILVVGAMLVYDYYTTTAPLIIRVADPHFSLLTPYNASTYYKTDDTYEQLIDLKNFTFQVNPQPCQNYTEGLLLVVIISSNPKNYENRMMIRNTWGRSVDSAKVVFLIGEFDNADLYKKVQNESLLYGDMVHGNFLDAYRNMTYKHVMGLKWVAHHCPMAKYVLKTDDDVLVNSHQMRQFLARELSPWGATGLIACEVLENAKVQRSHRSKWWVSPEEYAPRYYPTYCAGWAILYSQDVIHQLLKAAQSSPYFWIDDVHITGILAERLGIARTHLGSLVLSRSRAHTLTTLGYDYVGTFLLGPWDLSVSKVSEIWKAIPA